VDPDHPVFDLVPRPLNNFIQGCYEDLGRPPITRQSVWTIYLDLYDSMQRSVQVPAIVRSLTDGTDPDEEPLSLLENQNNLFFHEDTHQENIEFLFCSLFVLICLKTALKFLISHLE
jgi:hypothetical protein